MNFATKACFAVLVTNANISSILDFGIYCRSLWGSILTLPLFRSLSPDVEPELRSFARLKTLDLSSYGESEFQSPGGSSSTILANIPDWIENIHLSEAIIQLADRDRLRRCTEHLEVVHLSVTVVRRLQEKIASLIALDHRNLRELKLCRYWFSRITNMTTWLQDACEHAGFPQLTSLKLEMNYYTSLSRGIFYSSMDRNDRQVFTTTCQKFIRMHPQLEILLVFRSEDQLTSVLGDLPRLKALRISLPCSANSYMELQNLYLSPTLSWLELNIPDEQEDRPLWVSYHKSISTNGSFLFGELIATSVGGPIAFASPELYWTTRQFLAWQNDRQSMRGRQSSPSRGVYLPCWFRTIPYYTLNGSNQSRAGRRRFRPLKAVVQSSTRHKPTAKNGLWLS